MNQSEKDEVTQSFVNTWLKFHCLSPYQRKQAKSSPLKPSAFRLLNCLYKQVKEDHKNECSVSELSKMLRVTSPTITQMVTHLEQHGWVKRQIDLNDRRTVRVHITEQGKFLVEQERAEFLQLIQGLIEHLGVEDSQQLTRLMDKTLHYFQETRG